MSKWMNWLQDLANYRSELLEAFEKDNPQPQNSGYPDDIEYLKDLEDWFDKLEAFRASKIEEWKKKNPEP